MTVLDTPEGIEFFQLASRKAALKLENAGLKHSRSRTNGTVYALCKRAYNLTGTRAQVLAQMQALVDAALNRADPPAVTRMTVHCEANPSACSWSGPETDASGDTLTPYERHLQEAHQP